MHISRLKRLLLTLSVFALGALSVVASEYSLKAFTVCNEDFELLNHTTNCEEEASERTQWQYEPLRAEVIDKVEELGRSGEVPYVSVFFRDLHSGSRFGVREYEKFVPASLLKLPVMMVLLYQADTKPAILDEQITLQKVYPGDFEIEDPSHTIEPNTSYSIRELMEKMIKYSDNSSAYALLDRINASALQLDSNTFSDLGTWHMMSGTIDNTQMISYANLFSTLYNSSYLSPQASQFALELLTQTTFTEGIVAGVPSDVRVAHKFGVHAQLDEKSDLHDCGIVYHKTSPYVLCILTSGSDLESEIKAIREISAIVYKGVDEWK